MSTVSTPDLNASGFLHDPTISKYDAEVEWSPSDWGEVPEFVRSAIPNGARVLDVGCAGGATTLKVTADKNCEVVGIEPDEGRAAAARNRGMNVEVGYFDAESLKRLGTFDVILFMDVLEHVPNPASLVDLAASGLKPGGLLIASVPNVAHWTVRLNLLRGRFEYARFGIMDATHLRWFTRRSLLAFAQRCGLVVQRLDPAMGGWMGVYNDRLPIKAIPVGVRRPILRWLAHTFPGAFASQFVLCARVGDAPPAAAS